MNTLTLPTWAASKSWASVRGGKWHVTVADKPEWTRDETAICGLTFRPLNVTWAEAPPTSLRHLCAHCVAAAQSPSKPALQSQDPEITLEPGDPRIAAWRTERPVLDVGGNVSAGIADSDGLLVSYECDCGAAWRSHWSCACDDECDDCGATVEASDYWPDGNATADELTAHNSMGGPLAEVLDFCVSAELVRLPENGPPEAVEKLPDFTRTQAAAELWEARARAHRNRHAFVKREAPGVFVIGPGGGTGLRLSVAAAVPDGWSIRQRVNEWTAEHAATCRVFRGSSRDDLLAKIATHVQQGNDGD
jgi:hypothetical protein